MMHFLALCYTSDPNDSLYFVVQVTPEMERTMGRIHKHLTQMNDEGLDVLEVHKICKMPVFFRDYNGLAIADDIPWDGSAGIEITEEQYDDIIEQLGENGPEAMRLPTICIGTIYVRWQARTGDEQIYETPIFPIER